MSLNLTKREVLLRQATRTVPKEVFASPEGKKGIYWLEGKDGMIIRTFLIEEVARKKRELTESDTSGTKSNSEREY